jgi:hypothetical protein
MVSIYDFFFHHLILVVCYTYPTCRNPSFGLTTKARGCKVAGVKRKEARESKGKKPRSQKEGSPGAKAKALEGCGPRGSSGVITYSRESKEVRGSVRE